MNAILPLVKSQNMHLLQDTSGSYAIGI